LRQQWQAVKQLSGQDEVRAIITERGLKISVFGYLFVKMQMNKLGLEGTPYIDCKTFIGWKESGFMVRKGERSQIKGITWISAGSRNEVVMTDAETGADSYLFPKEYHLFHRSQVEEL